MRPNHCRHLELAEMADSNAGRSILEDERSAEEAWDGAGMQLLAVDPGLEARHPA